jgi:hypothetical protein
VNGERGDAAHAHLATQLVAALLRLAEDDCALADRNRVQDAEEASALPEILNDLDDLRDVRVGAQLHGADVDLHPRALHNVTAV